MKLLTHIPAFLKNKYLITLVIFGIVVIFLDKNDLITQLDRRQELLDLQQSKKHYTTKIAAEQKGRNW